MDYHVITPEVAELVMQVIDGQLVIVPPAAPKGRGAERLPDVNFQQNLNSPDITCKSKT